jgi:acetyl-CoA C-acetyltransferase
MTPRSVVIAAPVRTAIGTFGGSLKDVPAVDLGAAAVRATIGRAALRPEEIGTAVLGNVVQAGNKMNPARQAAIRGGLPVQVPAMTVNRVCGSGAQAIVSAAQEILLGRSMRRWPAAWRTWTAARTCFPAAAGANAWATASCSTACCATV